MLRMILKLQIFNGKTRREVAYQLGVRFKVVPKIPLEDGIHATTMTLPSVGLMLTIAKNS